MKLENTLTTDTAKVPFKLISSLIISLLIHQITLQWASQAAEEYHEFMQIPLCFVMQNQVVWEEAK